MGREKNLFPTLESISPQDRYRKMGHEPVLFWFTGLSGSGKSSLADRLNAWLFSQGYPSLLLDGDSLRQGLCQDLDFSKEGRMENMRRVAEAGRLLLEAGVIPLVALVSPYLSQRDRVRNLVGTERFVEVFVDCPLRVCEERDVKGLYRRVREGEIKDFTGVNMVYEAPTAPDIRLDTGSETLEMSFKTLKGHAMTKIKSFS